MVSHLLNIDETLASNVGGALGLKKMPNPADAAIATRRDLDPSPALGLIENGPKRFEGRKLGIVVTDGVDAAILKALTQALAKEGATFEIISPKVDGVRAGDGGWVDGNQMLDGAPSVLYDAVALLPSESGAAELGENACTRDFVADAFAHCKFIGYVEAARPLFEKAGIDALDDGVIKLANRTDVGGFIATLGQLRLWSREPKVKPS
jgi:catalase